MYAEIGYLALVFSLLTSIYAVFVSVAGGYLRRTQMVVSARNAVWVTFFLMTLSAVMLQSAIVAEQYQISYVWSVSSPDMPAFFRWTALWGSQAGSLIFWSFLMSGFTAAAVWFNWNSDRRLMPYFIAFAMAVMVFFTSLSVFYENPFTRYWLSFENEVVEATFQPEQTVAPATSRLAETARGLNPLLRHFGMAIHPPMLYLGFVGFLIPFAFAMSALASGDLSTNWIKATRRWTLVAWLFLSLGLVLGGRWAYDVLGWGGYWGWDPVENAAFLPWLMGTAFLHSVMMQEKRGMLKVWNMYLVILTFSSVMFGTFATRSGLIDSVHSFARSEIGFPMFFFWLTLTVVGVVMIMWRQSRGELQDEHRFDNLLSRESMFVLNNFVFLALFVAIFWGSFGAPITAELFMGTDITLGTDYFYRVTPPLFALMYLLMAVAPLSAWGMTSINRLGQALIVPFLLTCLAVGGFALMGMTSPGALSAYGLVTLAAMVALYEFWRGTAARVRSRGESWPGAFAALMRRSPRRYGGYIVHMGIAIIGVGVIGSTLFQVETTQTIQQGETVQIPNTLYEMTFTSFDSGQITQDGRIMDIANVSVFRNGRQVATLRPRTDFFPSNQDMNSMTIAGSHSTLENDFYVLLTGWDRQTLESATFKVYVNPLVNLVWWGSFVLIAGTIFTTWPREILPERMRNLTRASSGPGALAAGAGD
jgi:cytochrome c-type biogenesis protein CcmF